MLYKQFRLLIVSTIIMFISISAKAQYKTETVTTVVISTNKGDIKILLYDETMLHKDNFISLIKDNYYNNQLFHRVIKNFMIQGGDPNSVNAPQGEMLGRGGPGYTIPAEFFPHLIHKKGALAAARMPDKVNPNKESSGSQFYIVQGQTYTDEQLDMLEKNNSRIKFSEEDRNTYKTIGGTPHLDYNYTVFGEVFKGFDVLDAIAAVPVDKNNRPLEDIVIKAITISK